MICYLRPQHTSSILTAPTVFQGHSIRPWLSIFDPSQFAKLPPSFREVRDRMTGNIDYFAANYGVIALLLLLLKALLTPSLLVTLICLGCLWWYSSSTDEITVCCNFKLRGGQKKWVLSLLSVFFLYLFAGRAILDLIGLVGLGGLFHAALHIPMAAGRRK